MTFAPAQTISAPKSTSIFSRLRDMMARRAIYIQTSQQLIALSDRELNDIGITRGDIARIARGDVVR